MAAEAVQAPRSVHDWERHIRQTLVLDLEMAGEDVLLVIEFIEGANVEELVDNYRERQELLPVPYFHVVFTLPQDLRDLVRQHQKTVYPLLMQAAATALMKALGYNFGAVRNKAAGALAPGRRRPG